MAIEKKLIHFNNRATADTKKFAASALNNSYYLGPLSEGLETTSGSPDIKFLSIVYIKDTREVWTHGCLYSGEAASTVAYNVSNGWWRVACFKIQASAIISISNSYNTSDNCGVILALTSDHKLPEETSVSRSYATITLIGGHANPLYNKARLVRDNATGFIWLDINVNTTSNNKTFIKVFGVSDFRQLQLLNTYQAAALDNFIVVKELELNTGISVPELTATNITSSTITSDSIHSNSYSGGLANSSESGLMSSSDKTKLDSIANGAEPNVNAFSTIKVYGTKITDLHTINADSKQASFELAADTSSNLSYQVEGNKIIIKNDLPYTDKAVVNTLKTSVDTILESVDILEDSVSGLLDSQYDLPTVHISDVNTIATVTKYPIYRIVSDSNTSYKTSYGIIINEYIYGSGPSTAGYLYQLLITSRPDALGSIIDGRSRVGRYTRIVSFSNISTTTKFTPESEGFSHIYVDDKNIDSNTIVNSVSIAASNGVDISASYVDTDPIITIGANLEAGRGVSITNSTDNKLLVSVPTVQTSTYDVTIPLYGAYVEVAELNGAQSSCIITLNNYYDSSANSSLILFAAGGHLNAKNNNVVQLLGGMPNPAFTEAMIRYPSLSNNQSDIRKVYVKMPKNGKFSVQLSNCYSASLPTTPDIIALSSIDKYPSAFGYTDYNIKLNNNLQIIPPVPTTSHNYFLVSKNGTYEWVGSSELKTLLGIS